MKELLFLFLILLIVSNAELIRNKFIEYKNKPFQLFKNKNENYENFNINKNIQIFNLPNYKFYINSYNEIRNSNLLNMYFSELVEVESINMFHSIDLLENIKNKSLVFSIITNNKPIASVCVCNVKDIQSYLDKLGLIETYIQPIHNGYCIFEYLVKKDILIQNQLRYYKILLNEIEKWAKNPNGYDLYQIQNMNIGYHNNIYVLNKEIYKNHPKAYYLIIFGPKFSISPKNGVSSTHKKIANLIYENQFVLDWAKKSKLNKIFNVKPIPTNNIYLCENKKFNIDNYKPKNDNETFEYKRYEYLIQNDYNETGYNFMNNWTFYIKYIPNVIKLYKSEQVVNVSSQPYNY